MTGILKHRRIALRLMCLPVLALLLMPVILHPFRQIIFLSRSVVLHNLDSQSEKLQRMVFTCDEFAALNFIRPGEEFVYRGNQYDVQSITRSGNHVIVKALWDKMETSILNVMSSQVQKNELSAPATAGLGFMPYFHVSGFHPDFDLCNFYRIEYQDIKSIWTDPCIQVCFPPPEFLTAS